MHATEYPTTVFVIAVLVAVFSHLISERMRMPPILLWLLGGMLLGPYGLHVLHAEMLQPAMHTLIELGLAIILFEGGLNLNLKTLREHGAVVSRLIVLGPFLTMFIGGVVAHTLTDMSWPMSLLFGAIVSVGGPTVIMPIIQQVRLDRAVSCILSSEAMLVDAVGAILAIVMLQLTLNPETGAMLTMQSILYKIAIGTAVGFIGGWLLGRALLANITHNVEVRSIFTLAIVWALFLIADYISAQAGLMAVLVAGASMQKMDLPDIQRLRHFKASLAVLLISVLFVLLAAQLNLQVLVRYLWQGIVIFIVLAVVARPLVAWLSGFGSSLKANQIHFLGLMAPRGVVAAAITSLFALSLQDAGFKHVDTLVSLVFTVIILSVFIYGSLAGFLSRKLAVNGSSDTTVLLIGGGQMAAEMGRVLCHDREVRFLDMNAEAIGHMKQAGFQAVQGNALDPLFLDIIHAQEVSAVLVMTGSSDHNLLIAAMAREQFHVPEIYVALQEGDQGKHAPFIHQLQAKRLFAKPYTATYWMDQAMRKRLIHDAYTIPADSALVNCKLADTRITHGVQPMAILRNEKTLIPHDDLLLEAEDEILFLLRFDHLKEGQSMILPPAVRNAHETT
ncbi:MAG: cation:proton antiporter [Mariprofundaceae bacterium]|nr:cation:proton antiporter [Mariprofundaceae bacterium]